MKAKKPLPKNKQQTKENPAKRGTIAQLKLSVNYAMYRLVSTSLKSFWDHDTLSLKYLSYPNFHLGKTDMYVIFFCTDMKRKQEGKAERKRCYPWGSGGIWLFWSWYQQLPPHGRNPVPTGLHGFPCSQDSNDGPHSSSSKRLNTNQNVSIDRIVRLSSHTK